MTCPGCGARALAFLGQLGALTWFHCRACGMGVSSKRRQPRKAQAWLRRQLPSLSPQVRRAFGHYRIERTELPEPLRDALDRYVAGLARRSGAKRLDHRAPLATSGETSRGPDQPSMGCESASSTHGGSVEGRSHRARDSEILGAEDTMKSAKQGGAWRRSTCSASLSGSRASMASTIRAWRARRRSWDPGDGLRLGPYQVARSFAGRSLGSKWGPADDGRQVLQGVGLDDASQPRHDRNHNPRYDPSRRSSAWRPHVDGIMATAVPGFDM